MSYYCFNLNIIEGIRFVFISGRCGINEKPCGRMTAGLF